MFLKTLLGMLLLFGSVVVVNGQDELAQRNPAACKINNENWCGSGSLCGYWTNEKGVAGALVLTNAHVATTRINDAMELIFVLGSGQARAFTGYNLIAAYSNRDAVDWAIVFVPGLTADSGIEPLPLSKKPPEGSVFQFTGSPRCIWPQSSIDIRLVDSSAEGVVMWQPITIGGQSGSSVRRMLDNGKSVAEILLTWSWNRNGAGQPTSLIFNNIQNKSNIGPVRPEGLIEVGHGIAQIDDGYFESLEFKSMAIKVGDLPIWHDDDEDPVDPVDPPAGLTPEETAAALNLKAGGFSIVKVAEMHLGLLQKKSQSPSTGPALSGPIADSVPDSDVLKGSDLTEQSSGTWWFAIGSEPPRNENGEYVEGQIHNGWRFETQCDGVECRGVWSKIQ